MTRVTVLQLDTRFPRVPGDVACAETYREPPELLRIARADVASVVTQTPDRVDIGPFVAAARQAKGDVVTTSCGFLAPFEAALSAEIDRPVLASSLGAVSDLPDPPEACLVLTFSAEMLSAAHFAAGLFARVAIAGLAPTDHLRQVIAGDLTVLDQSRAERELVACARQALRTATRRIVFECTNLPPYKRAVRAQTGCATFDILDRLEDVASGTIRPDHL